MESRILRDLTHAVCLQGGYIACIGLGGGLDVLNAAFVRELLLQYAREVDAPPNVLLGSVRTCTDQTFSSTHGALGAVGGGGDGVYCVRQNFAAAYGADSVQQVSINSMTEPRKNYRSRYAEPLVAEQANTTVYMLSCARVEAMAPVREAAADGGGGFEVVDTGTAGLELGVKIKRDTDVLRRALAAFCTAQRVDAVVFVDGGGDALITHDADDGGLQGARTGQDYDVLAAAPANSLLVVLAPGIDIKPDAFCANLDALRRRRGVATEHIDLLAPAPGPRIVAAARIWQAMCMHTVALAPAAPAHLPASLTATTFYHASGGFPVHADARAQHMSVVPGQRVLADTFADDAGCDACRVFYTGARWKHRTPDDDEAIARHLRAATASPALAGVSPQMFSVLKRGMCSFAVIADAAAVHAPAPSPSG